MTDREAMQQALHTLEGWANHGEWVWPESALEQAKRNTTEAIAALRERLAQPEQKPEPPPWWPAVENILNEYGLQAIDFVADFKEAMAQPEQEPIKESSVTHSHLWIGDLYGKEKNT